MNDLPFGWVEVSLSDVADVIPGQAPPGESYNESAIGLPLFQGKTDFTDLYVGQPRMWTSDATKIAEPEDVLLSVRAPVGPTNLARERCAIGRGLVAIRGRPGVTQRYLLYALRATASALERNSTGTTFAAITSAVVRNHAIRLAPTPEQKRIVAAIEEQFTRLDAGVSALDRVRQRLRFLRDKGLLALIPSAGDAQRLGDVAEIRLGRQRSPKNHTGPRLRPYLRAANVTWNGLDVQDVKSMNFTSAESVIYELRRGDVLVAEASGSASEVGKPAIWDGSIANCCFQNTLLRIRSERFIPEYLYFVLLAHARGGTFARASRGVGIHHLSKSGLSALPVSVPDIGQQEAIVRRARSLQTAVARLLDNVEKQSVRVRTLRSAILAAAFSGKLVDQDASGEHASALVDRIAGGSALSNGQKTRVGRRPARIREQVPA